MPVYKPFPGLEVENPLSQVWENSDLMALARADGAWW